MSYTYYTWMHHGNSLVVKSLVPSVRRCESASSQERLNHRAAGHWASLKATTASVWLCFLSLFSDDNSPFSVSQDHSSFLLLSISHDPLPSMRINPANIWGTKTSTRAYHGTCHVQERKKELTTAVLANTACWWEDHWVEKYLLVASWAGEWKWWRTSLKTAAK